MKEKQMLLFFYLSKKIVHLVFSFGAIFKH